MKQFFFLLLIALAARAEGLNQKLVPANTKWLLHLDGEAFRKSKIGAFLVDQKLEKFVEQAKKDLGTELDFSYNKITALTAFGARANEDAHSEGVLLIQTTANVRGDLDKIIALRDGGKSPEPTVVRMKEDGVEYFVIGGELKLVPAKNVWLLGKSRRTLFAARDVVLGKSAALNDPEFLNYPTITNSFFFLAVADTGAAGVLPAQAKILQKAEGGRVIIGEKSDSLFLNLALRSKDTQTIAQISQIAQGILAFASLRKPDDQDLSALTRSAQVSAAGEILSVNLSFPINRAIERAREEK